MPEWFNTVLPVLTLILGAAGAFAQQAFGEGRQDRREREGRQHERVVATVERREEFELTHLAEFHRLLQVQADALMTYNLAERNRQDPGSPFPEEPHDEMLAVERRVQAQIGLILPEGLRQQATEIHEALSDVGGDLAAGALPDLDDVYDQLAAFFDALAARVREIYAGRDDRSA
ncbi:hypothetical protein [Streptomyces sp. SBT349]|uniref:hypothetical protein n=1 Tax=Streptomyces sp. SBT349 TaxID=1580539 RepID=UPI00066AACCA|nr:hypothetical protein [Streptomyces sp. SBT349]